MWHNLLLWPKQEEVCLMCSSLADSVVDVDGCTVYMFMPFLVTILSLVFYHLIPVGGHLFLHFCL